MPADEEKPTTDIILVTSIDTIKPGQMSCFDVNNRRIILAWIDDEYFAFDEMCSHEDAELWKGALRKDHIECPLHGSRFCLRTGNPMEEPATAPISTYPVTIKNGSIYVELSD
ncbi:Ferredoxin, 2Fe-2S [hydrothermal vent metagenome]|uniref:Ferredoxin, 2Fe-2S n=1 Tax=hydrothermal vent metagenome TaxID=652676 RepID=A0A3B1AI14_9ZZZZ